MLHSVEPASYANRDNEQTLTCVGRVEVVAVYVSRWWKPSSRTTAMEPFRCFPRRSEGVSELLYCIFVLPDDDS
eukprot:6481647-Amphidinium_carterae.2